ncbi:MAG TPA: gluconate 2-dehydrogenase subunit 3 family protein [Steroidobacteraceae bacterium]|nr:gluconate 2-dehydrogenase subunit 3 family protein [Steroidobacteraceae bacterium]
MSDRRSFLRGASVLMGHAAFGQVMSAFAAAPRKATYFTDAEMDTLRALVDVILPATDSPAASAADTHYFIDMAIPACASADAQKSFRAGLKLLSQKKFAALEPAEQVKLLEARAAADLPLAYDQSFFKILKDYTLTGYFLSEVGATQALAYERVPGGFQGDLPLAANQKAWAI